MARTTEAWYDDEKRMVLIRSTNPMTSRAFFVVVPPQEVPALLHEMAESLRQAVEAADLATFEASAAEMHAASARRADAVQAAAEIAAKA